MDFFSPLIIISTRVWTFFDVLAKKVNFSFVGVTGRMMHFEEVNKFFDVLRHFRIAVEIIFICWVNQGIICILYDVRILYYIMKWLWINWIEEALKLYLEEHLDKSNPIRFRLVVQNNFLQSVTQIVTDHRFWLIRKVKFVVHLST